MIMAIMANTARKGIRGAVIRAPWSGYSWSIHKGQIWPVSAALALGSAINLRYTWGLRPGAAGKTPPARAERSGGRCGGSETTATRYSMTRTLCMDRVRCASASCARHKRMCCIRNLTADQIRLSVCDGKRSNSGCRIFSHRMLGGCAGDDSSAAGNGVPPDDV